MGISTRRARIIGFLLLGVVTGGAAHAAERMHMPFDCRFDGERVHLRPSDERTYAVFGRHQREIFTACSPDDSRSCRNWLVYRFEFDCGGARVAWLDAAAAATRFADWDAWAEDGRFAMRMGPDWGVARDRSRFARRRSMRRHYRERMDTFDENPFLARRIVTAPPGYAPAVGIPLTFSGAESREVAQESIAPPAVAAYVAETAAPPATPPPRTLPELPVRAPAREQRATVTAPPAAVAAPAPKPEPAPKVAAATDAPPPAPKTAKVAPDAKAAEGAAATQPGGFTIINAPRPAAAAPEPTPPPAPPAAPAQIATGTVATPAAGNPAPAVAETQAVAETDPVHPEPPPATPATLSPVPAAEGPRFETLQVATAAALVLAVLSVLGFWYWRRTPAQPLPAARDFGAISLGGAPQGTALALEPAAAGAGLDETPPAPDQSAEGSAVIDELPVPTTYAQALEILGSSPDASDAAIKKIVDGLRQSWHPDLARSDADRAHRERRVRQINVAWDLVAQRRSAA